MPRISPRCRRKSIARLLGHSFSASVLSTTPSSRTSRGAAQRLRRGFAAARHQPQQILLGDVALFQHADVAAIAQHRHPVG